MAKKLEIVAVVRGGKLCPLDLFDDEMAQYSEGQMVHVFIETPKPEKLRSSLQNASMWKWATKLAELMNYHGFDKRKFYERVLAKGGKPIPWSKESVVDDLWRPYQVAITGKKSTTKPGAGEYTEIYKHVDFNVAQMTNGIRVEWPCKEAQMMEDYNNEQSNWN